MKEPASRAWIGEANQNGDEEVYFQDRHCDPETGVKLLRLTSLPIVNTHIYPEVPVSTPDGRRFIFRRNTPGGGPTTHWIGDLVTRKIRQITDEQGAGAPIVAPDGKWFYYSVGRTIWRMSPETFEREEHYRIPDELGQVGGLHTISGCGTRTLVSARPSPNCFGVATIDLEKKTARYIFEQPDCRNPHQQYSRNHDHKVMVQINDGIAFDAEGNMICLIGENGASLHVLDDDGSNHVKLRVGSSPLERVQGHQCWLGQTNLAITTTHRRSAVDQPWRQNRIVAIGADDTEYRIICEGGDENFVHMHTTLDGRFWVSDCNRTAKIYIGSTRTGRYRLFCSSGATFGSAQFTHPHPFFLGDDKSIGFNSDKTGIPHIYVAPIPQGFLESLE